MTEIFVVGAGPKAVALAAKSWAARQVGVAAPVVRAADPLGVGGYWRFGGGWSNGRHYLGTPPEKDVGFPYCSEFGGLRAEEIDRVLAQVSWSSFLIAHDAYAKWVDRGRPAPRHSVFADYLSWVADIVGLEVIEAPVVECAVVAAEGGSRRWSIRLGGASDSSPPVVADSLVVTGPGPATGRLVECDAVWSVSDFWQRVEQLEVPRNARWLLIGAGESAGVVAQELLQHAVERIDVVSPAATAFSRGEGQFENSLYSSPQLWDQLTDEQRDDVLARTDRGVLSIAVQAALARCESVDHVSGVVTSVRGRVGAARVDIVRDAGVSVVDCDVVVDCRGGDPLWFVDLLADPVRGALATACGGQISAAALEGCLVKSTAVGLPDGWPGLFLPQLSGRAVGPGLANLSCLGHLSDRILAGVMDGDSSRVAASALRSEEVVL